MIIHDLKNPTLSVQNGLELALTRVKNIEKFNQLHSEMII